MLEILRDPMWQFIGASFTIITVIFTAIFFKMQHQHKALSYKILSYTPLVIRDVIGEKLQIVFEGKPVEDVYLSIIKIYNSGNTPIVSNDYERPINLYFGENSQILTNEVIEKNPDNLEVTTHIEGTKIMLDPLLLNKKDSITLKIILSQPDISNNNINIDGRIVGVKEIKEITENVIFHTLQVLSVGVLLGIVGSILIKMGTHEIELLSSTKLVILIILIISIILGTLLIYIGKKNDVISRTSG